MGTGKVLVLACGLQLAVGVGVWAATWYVSTQGSDSSGTGTLGQPFQSIARALQVVQPGDEVVLRGRPAVTPNEYAGPVRIGVAGLTLRSAPGERAVIACPWDEEAVAVCVQFDTSRNPAEDSSGSRLEGVEIVGGYYYGVKFETRWDWGDPLDRGGASRILLEDVVIHHTGNAAIKITPGCDDITVRRVEVHHTGLSVRPDSAEAIDNVNGDRMLVQDSYFHDIAGTGLYFKGGATDCRVERTRVERTGTACSPADPCGGGIFVGFDTSPEFFDLEANPEYFESVRGVVENCLVRDTPLAGIGLFAAKDAVVRNNTLVDTARWGHAPLYFGISFQDWEPEAKRPPSVNPTVVNNLVVGSATGSGECVAVRYSGELGGLAGLSGMPTADFNLYYRPAAPCTFSDARPDTRLEQGDLLAWQAHTGGERHSFEADPRLDPTGHLVGDSPAIDAGECVLAPATDIDREARPLGRGCDVGADEWSLHLRPPRRRLPQAPRVSRAQRAAGHRHGGRHAPDGGALCHRRSGRCALLGTGAASVLGGLDGGLLREDEGDVVEVDPGDAVVLLIVLQEVDPDPAAAVHLHDLPLELLADDDERVDLALLDERGHQVDGRNRGGGHRRHRLSGRFGRQRVRELLGLASWRNCACTHEQRGERYSKKGAWHGGSSAARRRVDPARATRGVTLSVSRVSP